MTNGHTPWKRLAFEIESRFEAVPLLGQVACLLCISAQFTAVEGSQVELCVVEAVNNSIQHAYQGVSDHKVELEVTLLSGQLIFDVWDWGIPGDAARMNADHGGALEVQPDWVDDIPESGRGLAIIQEVMDSFEYTPGTERNRFRMIKRHAQRHFRASELTQKAGLSLLSYKKDQKAQKGLADVTIKNSNALLEVMKVMFKPHPWHGISMGDRAPEIITCYIEIVPTDSVKYEIEKTTGYLKVDRPQRFSSFSPCLYGLIPRTYCGDRVAAFSSEKANRSALEGDHDPLDVCIFTEKPITHGDLLLDAIPIGGLRMLDGNEADDKIVAVLKGDAVFGSMQDIGDLPEAIVQRLVHYFLTYKQMPGAKTECEVTHVYGRQEAHHVILESKADYDERFADLSSLLDEVLPDSH